MNMSYESLSFDSTFFITIFSSIFFITLFGFILHIQVTEGQKQEMLRIKREVFRDKQRPIIEMEMIFFILNYVISMGLIM